MKHFFTTLIIIFLFGIEIQAQDVNNYKYVIVPEKFEFQDEPNEHQLNALTEFLFEKYGFKALYQEEFPENMKSCDALSTNILNGSGFLTTRLVLTLEDCYGNVIFSSDEGKSRDKDFKMAYHEALREAFLSVEALNYVYEAPKEKEIPEKVALAIKIPPKVENPEEIIKDEAPEPIPEALDFKYFQNGNAKYILKKINAGFALFRYGENEKFATLMRSGRGENYLYTSEKLDGNAFFDSSGNLLVEYIDDATGQLVQLKFEAAAQ